MRDRAFVLSAFESLLIGYLAWWHMTVIPALGRWREENQESKSISVHTEFEVSLGYTMPM